MANKRMFTMHIVDSDAFLDMPLSAQCLYFHLNMRADDDGFIGNPKRIQKTIGSNDDDLKLLIAKRFVLIFEDGVIVIKHWKMHNTLRTDRYAPTRYQENLLRLETKENNSYTLISSGNQLATNWQPSGTSGIDIGLDIDIDIDKDISLGDSAKEKQQEVDDFFDSVWKLFPRKLGKGSVSKSQKKKLFKVGYDQLSGAIKRYSDSVVGKEEQYIMYGSTFFNKGYLDYLDANYEQKAEHGSRMKQTESGAFKL
jgi:hypothetical protein